MNMIHSFQQVTWRDMMWRDVKNHKKRPEWRIMDTMGPQNNNYPQEWEDNIVIEK